jgi:hypothetical protein
VSGTLQGDQRSSRRIGAPPVQPVVQEGAFESPGGRRSSVQ